MAPLQKISSTAKKTLLRALLVAGYAQGVHAADYSVAFSGRVTDSSQGVAGARVEIVDTDLSDTCDAQGNFSIAGIVPNGVVPRAALPGGATLDNRGGHLRLRNPGLDLHVIIVTADGKSSRFEVGKEAREMDLGARLTTKTGVWLLRIASEAGARTYRYARAGEGAGELSAFDARRAGAAAKAAAEGRVFVLKVTASGHFEKRFAQYRAQDSNLVLPILPSTATLKERIQDFLGAGKTFRLAFLRKDLASGSKPVLTYVDFAEMAGDTMPSHAFTDSRFDGESVEAFAPSWSPDGRFIAYEAGRENFTFPTSRVYIQPLLGTRLAGPANTATNPRWQAQGGDTSLIWCTTGTQRGWADTAAATYKQKWSGGQLTGTKTLLAKGSYNGGLSVDGRYLATAFPWGVMVDLQTSEKRLFHIYPGHSAKAATDSVQLCNASVSRDSAAPSRLLFLDFGVPDGEAAYPNVVRPQHYAQHRMILIGDYLSAAPGRIVDFIDTPAPELAAKKTWDDPEWTNAGDILVASTRDPNGDLSDPLTPRQTQPDIYFIKLSTKETLKVFTGVNQTLPAAWIGP